MKKTILTLCIMLTAFASAWAEGEITGLKIEMKEADKGYIQILFTDQPVITHNIEAAQIIVSCEGSEAVTINMADIKELTHVAIDETVTGIENLFPATEKNARKGIYTLGGQKVQKIVKGQVYIINGQKVLVK